VHQPLADSFRSDAYVATPILSADRRPIGFLHADRFPGNDPVGPVDRDILWALAEGVGSLIERAALVSQVKRGRERIRHLSADLAATMEDGYDAAIDMRVPPLLPGPRTRHARRIQFSDHAASSIASLLTRRELEVLSLMARGETNAEIAAGLVVSENTVKSHVKQVLRKLQAANRAQAVSRYHGLLEDGPRS
jgi:DNA-binding CsgD family transcriptional regulator